MLEIVVALICVLAVYWLFLRPSKALFEGAANLPPTAAAVTAATEQAAPTKQRVVRAAVDLSERSAVVLYGTLTGTAKAMATKLADDAKQLFDLSVRVCAMDEYDYEDELHKELLVMVVVPTYEDGKVAILFGSRNLLIYFALSPTPAPPTFTTFWWMQLKTFALALHTCSASTTPCLRSATQCTATTSALVRFRLFSFCH
jgi:hypothetical protein